MNKKILKTFTYSREVAVFRAEELPRVGRNLKSKCPSDSCCDMRIILILNSACLWRITLNWFTAFNTIFLLYPTKHDTTTTHTHTTFAFWTDCLVMSGYKIRIHSFFVKLSVLQNEFDVNEINSLKHIQSLSYFSWLTLIYTWSIRHLNQSLWNSPLKGSCNLLILMSKMTHIIRLAKYHNVKSLQCKKFHATNSTNNLNHLAPTFTVRVRWLIATLSAKSCSKCAYLILKTVYYRLHFNSSYLYWSRARYWRIVDKEM